MNTNTATKEVDTSAKETAKVLHLPTAKAAAVKPKPKAKTKVTAKKATKLANNATLKLPKENPHRKGTNDFKKFAKLAALNKRTVANAMEAGINRAYLNYMVGKELLEV